MSPPKKRKPNVKRILQEKIKSKGIKKVSGPPKTDYTKKEVDEYVKKSSKGKFSVIDDDKYRFLPLEKKFTTYPRSEATRQYQEHRMNFASRYQSIEGSEYKRTVPVYRTDKKTGERTYAESTRTVKRWRDSLTGRYVSLDDRKIIRVKRTGKLKFVPKPKKAGRDPLTGKFVKAVPSIREERKRMQKELTIYRIAEQKKIPVQEARRIYKEFEDEGMDRYLIKEYVGYPKRAA